MKIAILPITLFTLLNIFAIDTANASIYGKIDSGYIMESEGTYTMSHMDDSVQIKIPYNLSFSTGISVGMDVFDLPLKIELNSFYAGQYYQKNLQKTKGLLTSLYIAPPMFKNSFAQPYIFAGLGTSKTDLSLREYNLEQYNWLGSYGVGMSFPVTKHIKLDCAYRAINSTKSLDTSYYIKNKNDPREFTGKLPFQSQEFKIGIILHT